jgi:hypothetical protein
MMNRVLGRTLVALVCAAALGAPAGAQEMGGGGGGGGGGGVSAVATACGATGGTITTSGTIATALLHNAQSGSSYALTMSDCGKLVTTNNASGVTVTLLAPATAGNGYWFALQNLGAGAARLTPASGQINGASYLDVPQGDGVTVATDGSGYYAVTGIAGAGSAGVASFNSRTGTVTLEATDVSGAGALLAANNLADLASAATARSNLGLATVATSGSAADLSSGTLPAARLPTPGASTLGGVESKDCSSGGAFVQTINTDGTETCATPSGGGSPGGASGTVQYNNGGSFAGSTGLTVLSNAITGIVVGVTNVTSGTSCTADSSCGSATPDYFICINLGTPAPFTLTLPSSPATGRTILIKDCGGDANADNITVTPAAGDIDGAASYVMNTNHQSMAVTYDGTQWEIN